MRKIRIEETKSLWISTGFDFAFINGALNYRVGVGTF